MLPFASRSVHALLVATLAAGALSAAPVIDHDVPHFVLFTQSYGFVHDGMVEASAILQQLARNSHEFTVEVTSDPAIFDPATYERVDGFILPNNTGLGGSSSPLDDMQRAAFLAFVGGGGMVVAAHSTADSGGEWEAFDAMLGSTGFDMHPHLSLEARDNPAGRDSFNPAFVTDVTIQVEAPSHPTTAPWRGFDSFRITDEIYRWAGDPRSDPQLTVVLSLDEESHYWRREISPGPAAGGMAPGIPNPVPNPLNFTPLEMPDDSPISWVKPYGEGAVFYTNLGHNMATWERADFQEHLVRGIQWVTAATS